MTKSTKIYIVSAFSMEEYSDVDWPARAFYSRKKAEEFIKANPGIYDKDCFEGEAGWAYSSHIDEITLS